MRCRQVSRPIFCEIVLVIKPVLSEVSQGNSEISQTPVLLELLQVLPLPSEEPEDILRLFVRQGRYMIWDWWMIGSLSRGFCLSFQAVC